MNFTVFPILIFGSSIGVLIDYLADVLPYKRKLVAPFCTICQSPIRWQDFLAQRKCSQCAAKRTLRSWLVRLFLPVIFVALWLFPATRIDFWLGAIFVTVFSLIMVIDIEHRAIIYPVLVPAAGASFAIGWGLHGIVPTLIGGICGYLIMLVLYYLGSLFERLIARLRKMPLDEVALGFGDVNLSATLGFVLGFPGIIAGLTLAILLGGIVSLFTVLYMLITRRYRPFTALPYAPFLILGTAILLFRP